MNQLKVTKLTLFQDSHTNRLQLRTSSYTIGNQFDNNTIQIVLERLDKFPSYPAYLVIQPEDSKPFSPIQITSGHIVLSNLFTQSSSLTVQIMLKRNYDAIYSDSLKLKLNPSIVNNSPIDIDGIYNKPINIDRLTHIVTKEELRIPDDFPFWDHTGNCPVCGKPACPYDPTNPDNADKQPGNSGNIDNKDEVSNPPLIDDSSKDDTKKPINPSDIVYPSITDPIVASLTSNGIAAYSEETIDTTTTDTSSTDTGTDTTDNPSDTSSGSGLGAYIDKDTGEIVIPDTSTDTGNPEDKKDETIPPVDNPDNTDDNTGNTSDNTEQNKDNTGETGSETPPSGDNTGNTGDNQPPVDDNQNPPAEETPKPSPSVPITPIVPATPIRPIFDLHIDTPAYLTNSNHLLVFHNGILLEQSKYVETGNSISTSILISTEYLLPNDRLDIVSFG